MRIKRFRMTTKVLSLFFKVLAIVLLIMLVSGTLNSFIRESITTLRYAERSTFSLVFSNKGITDKDYEWALAIIIPLALASMSYISFKTSYLFDYLTEGMVPFSYTFTGAVRTIAFTLILYDLAVPLLYSLFVNWVATGGGFVYISVTSFFFIGLILLFVSQLIDYGILLQEKTGKILRIETDMNQNNF